MGSLIRTHAAAEGARKRSAPARLAVVSDDPPPPATDKANWAQLLGIVESPLQFFALLVLVVDGFIALGTFALPEHQRIYALVIAASILVLVLSLVALIAFFRPANLQKQVQDLQEIIDSDGFSDAIEDVLQEKLTREGWICRG